MPPSDFSASREHQELALRTRELDRQLSEIRDEKSRLYRKVTDFEENQQRLGVRESMLDQREKEMNDRISRLTEDEKRFSAQRRAEEKVRVSTNTAAPCVLCRENRYR